MQCDVAVVKKLGDVSIDFASMRWRMVLDRNMNDSIE